MTIYCKIELGAVVNRAEFEGDLPNDWPDFDAWVASDEAQIGWSYANGVFTPPPPPELPPAPEPPLALTQIASVRIGVDGWDVTGLERSTGLSLAFVADVDTVWIFFDAPQADTEYLVTPSDGVTKYTDYIEVTKPGLAAVSLIVQRVQ